jgi:acyl-coenzyme A thioesterase PaaI-like protein
MPRLSATLIIMTAPPPGFDPLTSKSPFVNRAGTFFVRTESDGSRSVGSWIGHDQSNSEVAHGGFLRGFADFALCMGTMGVTLTLSAEFLRPARVGQWIQAQIVVRKASKSLIFADAIVTSEEGEVLLGSGLFRPIEKRG